MNPIRIAFAVLSTVALLSNSGCSRAEPRPEIPTTSVKGKVNIDGKPVPTGEVHFASFGAPPRVSKITDGEYSGEAPVGENKVEVYIYKEEPNPRYPDNPTKVNTLPPKFWGPKTTLKATVKADGPNEFQFDVTSR